MRIKKQRKVNTKLVIISSLAAALVLGAGVFAWFSPSVPFFGVTHGEDKPENTVDYNKPTSDQKETGDIIKEEFVKNNYEDSDEKEESSSQSAVNISFSSVSQLPDKLSVRTILETTKTGGSCQLELTRGESRVLKTAAVQSMGSYSTCQGFDVPLNELNSGDWQMVLMYTDANGLNSTAKRQVTVNG